MSIDRSDGELVAATRGGDRGAFELLLDRHAARVRLLAVRMLRPEDAEDVVQEALLQAFLGLERLREPERFGSWLYGITLNLARMRLRRRDPLLLDVNALEHPAPDGEAALEAVREALDVLSPREREAVVLHYVEGLDTQEVASLLGAQPGTVRVRLHRARRRLRRNLAELATSNNKEGEMIEVRVEDVVVRMSGENRDAASEITGKTRIVLLKEVDGERRLPIWIGPPEGDALALQLGGEAMPRPMTPDLLAKVIEATGATVERVAVNSLREETFYATIVLATGGGAKDVDARPSDALNLALRVGAPIHVADDVMETSAMSGGAENLDEEAARFGVDPEPPGHWRSLSPELVKSLHPPPPKRE